MPRLTLKDELIRVKRVSDMMTTMHSILRDRYACWSTIYDSINIVFSTWLCAMVFVDEPTARILSFGFDGRLFLGLLSVGLFVLSVLDLRINWKGKRDAHANAQEFYSNIKIRAGALLADGVAGSRAELVSLLEEYRLSGPGQAPVPDGQFNTLKRSHLMKVLISKHLTKHPGSFIFAVKVRVWFRDNRKPLLED